MPIEIRELHITTVVGTPPAGGSAGGGSGRGASAGGPAEDRERLVALVVERVMEVLARTAER